MEKELMEKLQNTLDSVTASLKDGKALVDEKDIAAFKEAKTNLENALAAKDKDYESLVAKANEIECENSVLKGKALVAEKRAAIVAAEEKKASETKRRTEVLAKNKIASEKLTASAMAKVTPEDFDSYVSDIVEAREEGTKTKLEDLQAAHKKQQEAFEGKADLAQDIVIAGEESEGDKSNKEVSELVNAFKDGLAEPTK